MLGGPCRVCFTVNLLIIITLYTDVFSLWRLVHACTHVLRSRCKVCFANNADYDNFFLLKVVYGIPSGNVV